MALIPALTEDFTGAAVGNAVTEANTTFDQVSGAVATFITDPFDASRRMMEITTASQFSIHEMDFTPAVPILWFRLDIDLETTFAANTAFFTAYDVAAGTNKIYDIRVVAGTRTIQLRNVNTSVWTSDPLTDNTKYSIHGYCKVDSTKSIRCLIYSGANLNTLVEDSGTWSCSTLATTCAHVRVGVAQSSTGTIRIGRLRGDNANQPFDATGFTRTVDDDLGLTDARSKSETNALSDNLALTDSRSTNLIGPSIWTYTKAVQIG